GAILAGGRGFEGGLEPGGIPAFGELAPTLLPFTDRWGRGWNSTVEVFKKLLVAEPCPVLYGVLENVVGQVDARQRSLRVPLRDQIDVAAEYGRLHVPGADHVVRHEQELLVLHP